MKGLRFFLLRQGRTAANLARLTGLPEAQITEMMEEEGCEKPSCFYMKVAAALGVSVEALVGQWPDDEQKEETDMSDTPGMVWEECFERRPNTICRIYLARITGPHTEYRFDRTFCRPMYQYSPSTIRCCISGLEEGVYEVCARWYDDETGELVEHQRSWFAAMDGVFYGIEERDVLPVSLRIGSLKRGGEAA